MAMLALVRLADRRLEARPPAGGAPRGLRSARRRVDARSRDRGAPVRRGRRAARDRSPRGAAAGSRTSRRAPASSGTSGRAALCAESGCGVIAVAHNRDDQAETILYRLTKYASPQALAGMRPREGDGPQGPAFARPLLCLGAGEVRAYCAARGIAYGEDASNARAALRAQPAAPRGAAASRRHQPPRHRDARRERRNGSRAGRRAGGGGGGGLGAGRRGRAARARRRSPSTPSPRSRAPCGCCACASWPPRGPRTRRPGRTARWSPGLERLCRAGRRRRSCRARAAAGRWRAAAACCACAAAARLTRARPSS